MSKAINRNIRIYYDKLSELKLKIWHFRSEESRLWILERFLGFFLSTNSTTNNIDTKFYGMKWHSIFNVLFRFFLIYFNSADTPLFVRLKITIQYFWWLDKWVVKFSNVTCCFGCTIHKNFFPSILITCIGCMIAFSENLDYTALLFLRFLCCLLQE